MQAPPIAGAPAKLSPKKPNEFSDRDAVDACAAGRIVAVARRPGDDAVVFGCEFDGKALPRGGAAGFEGSAQGGVGYAAALIVHPAQAHLPAPFLAEPVGNFFFVG